ncbi:hypothetical protein BDQ12DRAFT_674799 [Crucibulum laeve]|uniref:Uncharacterized protein n=1 Tax=Crucibulum laeve TaxID=68775 RepID=A0A5C3MG00_9AGAR|nr:hypothetical protein BDQ12DRAFT_674799 [Crucibulum laeve]
MNISRKCSSRASQSASVSHQSQENIDRSPLYHDSCSTRVSGNTNAFSLNDEFLAYLHRSSTGSARPPSSSSQSQSTAVEELLAYPCRFSQSSISPPSFCSHSKANDVHSAHEHFKRQALYTQSFYLTQASALASEAPIPVPRLPTSTSCSTIASIYSQKSYEYTLPPPLVRSNFFSNDVMQESHAGCAFPDLVLELMAEIDAEIAEWRCLSVAL